MEPMVTDKNYSKIREYISQFKEYLNTNEAKDIISRREKEKIEVKNLMEKLRGMDKTSDEFTEWVLYGLLPYFKSKYAKRISVFPAFMNIKLFFKKLNYNEKEWNIVANKIFNLCDKFQKKPEGLKLYLEEYTSNKYSKMIQSGSITPILYCLNDNYHLVNNLVRETYRDIKKLQGVKDTLHQEIKHYFDSNKKLDDFAKSLNDEIFSDKGTLDLFCYWYIVYISSPIKKLNKKKVEPSEDKITTEFDFNKFVNKVDFDKLKKYEPPTLNDPERIKIRDIIRNCSKRKWVLPQFQRYFDWNENDVQEFLNSIFKDYYVGSFLMWDTTGKTPELGIQPIKGIDDVQDMRPDTIILDGQQRITSLYYAIKSPNFRLKGGNKPLFFYLNFSSYLSQDGSDMMIEKLPYELSNDETYKNLLFPLNKLEAYHDWVDGLQDYLNKENPEKKNEINEIWRIINKKLTHIWDGYEIPYVSLSEDIGIAQVTDIFEGINTKGKPLGVFDLLIARLYKDKIELKEIWDNTLERYQKISEYFERIPKIPVYIFQAIALCNTKTGSCKRKDILNINENIIDRDNFPFEKRWWEIVEYIDKSLDKLTKKRSNGYGSKDRNELPFEPMIPIIAALLKEIDTKTNKADCYKKLDIWYWSSVFSNHYSSAVDSTLTSDFKEMKEWFNDGEIANSVVVARRELNVLYLRDVQSQSNAKYRGVMSILAVAGSKDLVTGQTLEDAPKNEKHHLFPKSIFKSRYINSVLNMAWMSKDTNRIIHNSRPSEYIPKFITECYHGNEKEFLEVLRTHLINEKAYDCLKNDDFEGFISERDKIITQKIAELMDAGELPSEQKLITPSDPFDNKILFGEAIQSCEGYLYWIDKYFSVKGLTFLKQFINVDKVKEIKILMSIEKADEDLRSLFKDFKESLEKHGIKTELRVITDNKVKSLIHDRWILSKYHKYNIPSPDIIARGQYSEIKQTNVTLPFDDWWNSSKDIINQWHEINKK